ncbi:MAG: hypothetical protein WEB79_00155 [Thermoleophilaceae bacterium]
MTRGSRVSWDPLQGCTDWSRALRQARWLADADILAWLETDDRKAPVDILRSSGDPAAQSQLEGVLALDARNEGTTYMSAAHLLHAYRYPEVLAASKPGFTATDLLDGDAPTLYLTSSSSYQRMLAPILVAIVSSVIDAAIDRSRRNDQPLDPLLRVLLDETANCAPLRPLPAHLADVGASTAKIFLGPIHDATTRQEITDLLGQQPVDVDDHATLGPKASAQDLQQLKGRRALVVAGALPPAVIRWEPYWRTRLPR